MKNTILLFCIVLFFVTCKKNTPNLDVVGTWTLYSWQQSSVPGALSVNVRQYPCLSNNILQINADFTTKSSYIGQDTCYITPARGAATGINAIGEVGRLPHFSTWTRSGNDIYIDSQRYVISTSSGKLYLTTSIPITQNGKSATIFITVDIKE